MTPPARPDPVAAHNRLRSAIFAIDPKVSGPFTISDLSQFTDALLDSLMRDGSVLVNADMLAEALKAVTRNVLYRGDKQGAKWRADTAAAILAALQDKAVSRG